MISIRIRISVAVVFKRGIGCRTSVVDDASMIIFPTTTVLGIRTP